MATDPDSSPPQRQKGQPWPVPEFAGMSNNSPRHIRKLIAAGRIKVIRFGRKVMIPDDEARRLLAEGIGREGGSRG